MRKVITILLLSSLLIQLYSFAEQDNNARRYQQAMMLMDIGDYLTAASIFDSLGEYKNSIEMSNKARQLVDNNIPTTLPKEYIPMPTITPDPNAGQDANQYTLHVGDTLTFGNYEQDGNTRNGDEPIEWTVLSIQDSKALLLSKYGLDMKPFNNKRIKITWAESSIRHWLNNDFMYAAFNGMEADCIITTNIIAEPNPYYPKVPFGENTLDNVFLLSVNELERYLPYESQRFCLPTQYALDRGAYKNNKTGRCRWWLRSPGEDSKHAANVFTSGEYWDDYFKVDSSGLSIRPAIWIMINKQ